MPMLKQTLLLDELVLADPAPACNSATIARPLFPAPVASPGLGKRITLDVDTPPIPAHDAAQTNIATSAPETKDEAQCDEMPTLLTASQPPMKNTFIHFDIPRSPANEPEPPTSSAPSILMRRLFKKKDACQVEETPLAPEPADTQSKQVTKAGSCSDDDTPSVKTSGCSDDDLEFEVTKEASCASIASNESTATPYSNAESLLADRTPSSQFGSSTDQEAFQLHDSGSCTPCNYFWYKVDGCRQGDTCNFCHLCPKGEIKKRKKDKLKGLRAAGLVQHKLRAR